MFIRLSSLVSDARAGVVSAFDPTASEPIRIARVVCIFFMMYVHVNPGLAHFDPVGHPVRLFDLVRMELVNTMGRASIALLSVISGYLGVFSLHKAGYRKFVSRRISALVIPLAIWNIVFIVLVLVGEQVAQGYLARSLGGPITPESLPTLVFAAFGAPANEPLYFLRDIFICSLMAPFLIASWQRSRILFWAGVLVIYAIGQVTALLVTPNLLAFYAIGVAIALNGRVPQVSGPAALVAGLAVFALGAWITHIEIGLVAAPGEGGSLALEALLTVIRFPAAVLFWWMAVALSQVRWGRRLAALEPYIFFVFCAHMVILTLAWFGWQRVFGGYYGAFYPVFWLGAPLLALGAGVAGARVLDRLAPGVFALVNGGRALSARRQARQDTARS
jgi:hypothetical protein